MSMNPFMDPGNSEISEQIEHIQLAVIRAVDTRDMVADVDWLGSKGGRTRVALAQPMAGPGYGVLAIPRRGTVVAVGMRTMQIPIVLAYMPANVFHPHSFFSQMREQFGLADTLEEGDVLLRALSNVARCKDCNVVSSLAAWESNIDPATLLERCPSCNKPGADRNPSTGEVVYARKVHYGTTLHMRADGTTEFQLNNQSVAGRDPDRLLKIIVTPDSGITIQNAGDVLLAADKSVAIDCQNLTLNARDTISTRSASRATQVADTDVETYTSKTIKAADKLGLEGDSVSIVGKSLLSEEAGVRQATVQGDDVEQVGRKVLKSVSTVEVFAAGDTKLDAANIILQGGDKSVARVGDTVVADMSSDAAFFSFLSALVTGLTTSPTVPLDGGAAYKAGIIAALAGAGVPPAPSSITGKITTGNDTVKA